MYIYLVPPIGAYFKLKNLQSNRCMYSNSDGRFNDYTCENHEDQWWRLQVEHSSNENYYRIQNKQSGKCVYSNSDGRFNVYNCNDYQDQWWTFQSKPDNDNYFRINNLQSKFSYKYNKTSIICEYPYVYIYIYI